MQPQNDPALSETQNSGSRGNGCLKILLGIFVIFIVAVLFMTLAIRSDSAERKKKVQTLEGRAVVMAKEAFSGLDATPSVSLIPQVDGGNQLKVDYSIDARQFTENPSAGRKRILGEVRRFLGGMYQEGGAGGVAYFWFNPETDFVDEFGKSFRRPLAKIMLPRNVADKVSWGNIGEEQLENLLLDHGTLEWNRAALESN